MNTPVIITPDKTRVIDDFSWDPKEIKRLKQLIADKFFYDARERVPLLEIKCACELALFKIKGRAIEGDKYAYAYRAMEDAVLDVKNIHKMSQCRYEAQTQYAKEKGSYDMLDVADRQEFLEKVPHIIKLHIIDGYSFEEIAAIARISLSTAIRRYKKAIKESQGNPYLVECKNGT